jgi:serine protease SohB
VVKILLAVFVGMILFGIISLVLKKKKQKSKLLKAYRKEHKFKIKKAQNEASGSDSQYIFCVDFQGDMKASDRFHLSRTIDEIIFNKDKIKEVVLTIESPGGSVSPYGHAMSELKRLRDQGIRLVVCIDSIAASGGYLMSCVGTKILAAPYALVGSIGVVSFIPNIRGLLKRFDIEPRTFTAGNYKRTVTLTDEAGPEELKHFQEKLESIHHYFKSVVEAHRSQVNKELCFSGDYWLAQESVDKNLGLVDEIKTSSQYFMELNENFDLVAIERKRGFQFTVKKLLGLVFRRGEEYLAESAMSLNGKPFI